MSKDRKNTRKEQYMANRRRLIELSQGIRLAVKEGAYDSVNEGLREFYMEQNPEIEEFNTFWQWKDEGATIKKGSKAHLFWGQPRKVNQAAEGSDEPEEYKYWPICYLFDNTQVFIKGNEEETAKAEEPKMKPVILTEDMLT